MTFPSTTESKASACAPQLGICVVQLGAIFSESSFMPSAASPQLAEDRSPATIRHEGWRDAAAFPSSDTGPRPGAMP
jgi:hypothetical protein